MRNEPPGYATPLRKLIAPPERMVQIVSVISNHGEMHSRRPSSLYERSSSRPSLPLPLSRSLPLQPPPAVVYTRERRSALCSPFRSPFSSTRAEISASQPGFLHARFSCGWSFAEARHVTRDPPRRITRATNRANFVFFFFLFNNGILYASR